jgi:hypothetical protein
MFFQLTESQKVQPSVISNLQSAIKALTLDAVEPMRQSLATQMMEAEPESDCHQAQEKLFQETAEPQSELLLVEVECKSQS